MTTAFLEISHCFAFKSDTFFADSERASFAASASSSGSIFFSWLDRRRIQGSYLEDPTSTMGVIPESLLRMVNIECVNDSGLHRGNNSKRFTQKIQHIRNAEWLLQKRAAFKSVAAFHRRGKFARHENHQRLVRSRCLDHIRGRFAPRAGSAHSAKIQIAQQYVKTFLHGQLRS